MSEIAVQLRNVTKRFDTAEAVSQLDLDVLRGEILALVGPSGCGKTTTLRLIAGFERPQSGTITIDGRTVAGQGVFLNPEQRGVGMVFQDYALFPHLTVAQNVAFGLDKKQKPGHARTIEAMLRLVGLQGYAERYPHELSGGERQRVALARALAPRPILVLLDEPFSNLDAERRQQMREEVRVILKTAGATTIFVTHDQEEALFMGDRLAVFHRGRLEQAGTPQEIFHNPVTRFVASFMGDTDFLPGIVSEQGIQTETGLVRQTSELPVGTPVELAVRADDVSFVPQRGANSLILARHFKGALNLYRLRLPSGRLLHAFAPHNMLLRPGTPVQITIDPGHPLACFAINAQDGYI